jgi:hypothetical protein
MRLKKLGINSSSQVGIIGNNFLIKNLSSMQENRATI